MKKPAVFWIWWLLLILALPAGVLLTMAGLLSFETLKTLGDSLTSDGSLERLTPELYSAARLPALLLGLILLAGAAAWVAWRRQAQRMLSGLCARARLVGQKLRGDLRQMLADLRAWSPARLELLALLAIMLFALLVRLVFLQRPMGYDESYTFTEFARHSFRQILTDYHVRNNHVFHTLLVRAAYLLFGHAPWALRLPALLAGMLLVPAVYALGRRLYNASAGLLAAAGVAVYPLLAVYSANARGYSLMCLFTVLLLLLADYAREKRSLLAWVLMVLVTALGMFTIPIMLYSFGITVMWLFLSGLFGKIHPGYGGLLRWTGILAVFCIAAGLLTLLLYGPILSIYGLMAVISDNPAFETQALSTFLFELPYQFIIAKPELQLGGLPDVLLWLLAGGSLLAIILHRRIGRGNVPLTSAPMPLAAVLFLAPALLIQRPVFLARVWQFLLVLMILWTAAVLAGLPRLLRVSDARLRQARAGLVTALLLGILAWGVQFIAPYLANPEVVRHPRLFDTEQVTLYLKDHLREGDIVVISNLEDAPYWYYFLYYQIPERHIRAIKERPFRRVYVLTHPTMDLPVDGLIHDYGPDLWFVRMDTLHLETKIGDTLIYTVQINQAAVDQEYGVQSEK